MAYIDTKYLGKCETCRHHSDSGCKIWCDAGEGYSPNMFKIPTADVVEVVRCEKCNYRITHTCPITGTETLFCDYGKKPVAVEPTHYCSYGERKDG